MPYRPPYTITEDILTRVANISEKVGQLKQWYEQELDLRLCRINRIRTVAGFLTAQANTQVTAQVSDQLVALLNAMQPQRYYTTAELMQLLGLAHRESFRKTYLKPALAQGLVAMLIPEKPNSPKQKYRKV